MSIIDRMNLVPRVLIDSYVVRARNIDELYEFVCIISDLENISDDRDFAYMHMIIEEYWKGNNGEIFSVYFDDKSGAGNSDGEK